MKNGLMRELKKRTKSLEEARAKGLDHSLEVEIPELLIWLAVLKNF